MSLQNGGTAGPQGQGLGTQQSLFSFFFSLLLLSVSFWVLTSFSPNVHSAVEGPFNMEGAIPGERESVDFYMPKY